MQPMLGVARPVRANSCEQDYVYDEQIRQRFSRVNLRLQTEDERLFHALQAH
jgi:hypothetical protein